jgi:hypothetical protein
MKNYLYWLISLAVSLLCFQAHGAELTTSGNWSLGSNWAPATVPGATDDVLIRDQRWGVVDSDVGDVLSLVLGDSAKEGALNIHSGGSLGVLGSLVVSGPVSPYPSYYSHSAGDVAIADDFVIGDDGLGGSAFFSSGSLTVGAVLKVGAIAGSKDSIFSVKGGGGSVVAESLEVGAAGTVEFDFLGGGVVKTLNVSQSIGLSSGSTLVVSGAASVVAGDYVLIDGASISGIFTNVEFDGFSGAYFPSIQYDAPSGEVRLVVDGVDAVFDNGGFDNVWSNSTNWDPESVPGSTESVLIRGTLVVDSAEAASYVSVGDAAANAAFNMYAGGSLTLGQSGISMMVGGAANGAGYPSYYSHFDGTLTTAGDFILGANGAGVEAFLNGGLIDVGGTIRLGSYQSSGASIFKMNGGAGTIDALGLEIGSMGTLVFDFMGGNSIKTINVNEAGDLSIRAGATLTIQGAAAVAPHTYTLIQGGNLLGVFDQVNFAGFPASVVPRIWYDAAAREVKLVVEAVDNVSGSISGFSKIVPIGASGYSFGIAADGDSTLYSDYNTGTLTQLIDGTSSEILNGYLGMYGVAVDNGKVYFKAGWEDFEGPLYEATLVDGVVGSPSVIASGLTRVRQLFVDDAGQLLTALESSGSIVRIDPATGSVTDLVTGLTAPQAVVSDAVGNLYFNEYGVMGAAGVPESRGKLWKETPLGERTLLYEGWRLRGLTLLADDRLGLFMESDYGDRGNSASLVVLTTDGIIMDYVQGFDYPQFGAVNSDGSALTTAPREKASLSFIPDNTGGSDVALALRSGVTCVATVQGQVLASAESGSQTVTLTGLDSGSLTVDVLPDSSGHFAGWIRMETSEWSGVSTSELSYPDANTQTYTPGVFALPTVGVESSGSVQHVQVFAQRSQGLTRWPMQNVGTENESPQAGFTEAPVAYMVFVEAYFVRSLNWTGSESSAWDGPNFDFGLPNDTDGLYVPVTGNDPVVDVDAGVALGSVVLDSNFGVSVGGALEAAFFTIGQNLDASLNLNGGSLAVTNFLNVAGNNGTTANLNMSAGTHTLEQLFLNKDADATGGSFVTLVGGTLNVSTTLSINSAHSAVLNISGGTLILPNSNLGNVNYWIGSGNIVGYGGAGAVNVEDSGGLLTLTAVSPYEVWLDATWPALSDQSLDGDPDLDGILNLMEYVLQDGNPDLASTAILPTQDVSGGNWIFTIHRRAASAVDTTQIFQHTNDLNLDDWTDVPLVSGGIVSIVSDTPVSGIDQVTVTIPVVFKSKLFGRLKVTQF